jgi:hypothetical protein
MTNSNSIKVRLSIQDALRRIGIEKPHHLWLRFGGSKTTPIQLWEGLVEGVNFLTLERLLTIIRDEDPRAYEKMIHHLNASGLFAVEGSTTAVTKTGSDRRPMRKMEQGAKKPAAMPSRKRRK